MVYSSPPSFALSMRDLAIFNLAIDSKLRACDLVKLRLDDICSAGSIQRPKADSRFMLSGPGAALQMPVEAKVSSACRRSLNSTTIRAFGRLVQCSM